MEKLYKTQEVADLFNVQPATITYWRLANKLPATSRIPRQSFLYSTSDLINFIKKTHAGEYKNSSINVISALEKLNLQTQIILPPTKRLSSLTWYYNHIKKEKNKFHNYVVNFVPTVVVETRQEYITRTSKFTVTKNNI